MIIRHLSSSGKKRKKSLHMSTPADGGVSCRTEDSSVLGRHGSKYEKVKRLLSSAWLSF